MEGEHVRHPLQQELPGLVQELQTSDECDLFFDNRFLRGKRAKVSGQSQIEG